ncbi:MAG: restriction endonuclease subunit S [Chryseobacterium sp.]
MLVDRGGITEASNIPKIPKFNHYQPSDTLLSNIRTYFRKVWIADREGGASPDVLILRPIDTQELCSQYLFYIISSQEFIDYTNLTSKGAKMPRGDKEAMQRYLLHLPSPAEQKAIADILSILDEKIELNRKMNETLEEIAKALFKSWFVDFDPVRAKMAGKKPEGLSDDIAALFPDTFIDSPLGEIPEGWEVKEIGDLVNVVGGGTPSTGEPAYWEDGTIHWVTPKDLSSLSSKVLLNTERKITDKGLSKISSGLLPIGTVLLSSRAPIGYLVISEIPVAINQGFIAMKPKNNIGIHYILQWTVNNMEVIKSRANGSTFQEISKTSFRKILAILPKDEILVSFNEIARDLHKRVVENTRQIKQLSVIRDNLLPKLISGELRVSNAEKLMVGVL